ncbi:hypothetical protein FisN_3Lh076 [Fistulifera solaris]|uniref:Uncharacterized protein n=1 Tax=Fistulifera solaris TaxID=1519565 RepID=A0A1Z5JZ62_FISSO|nr:hypothetical protein FisN_3Lh076 [Fistulifera solaris]|eukprot:GAX19136.1 hypothetical protein FisN_3Lh076 [Fistulifera solaris]
MARKSKKGWQETGKVAGSRPRRNAARRFATTYREDSDSDLEVKERPTKFLKGEKDEDDATVDTNASSLPSEDESEKGLCDDDAPPSISKLASKKASKAASMGIKQKPLRKKINQKAKQIGGKRKRVEKSEIDDSHYIVSPPKRAGLHDDNPVDWRVHSVVDY